MSRASLVPELEVEGCAQPGNRFRFRLRCDACVPCVPCVRACVRAKLCAGAKGVVVLGAKADFYQFVGGRPAGRPAGRPPPLRARRVPKRKKKWSRIFDLISSACSSRSKRSFKAFSRRTGGGFDEFLLVCFAGAVNGANRRGL